MDIATLNLTRSNLACALDYATAATAKHGDDSVFRMLRRHLIIAEGRIRCEIELFERHMEEQHRQRMKREAEAELSVRSDWGTFVDIDRLYLDTPEGWNEPLVDNSYPYHNQ